MWNCITCANMINEPANLCCVDSKLFFFCSVCAVRLIDGISALGFLGGKSEISNELTKKKPSLEMRVRNGMVCACAVCVCVVTSIPWISGLCLSTHTKDSFKILKYKTAQFKQIKWLTSIRCSHKYLVIKCMFMCVRVCVRYFALFE